MDTGRRTFLKWVALTPVLGRWLPEFPAESVPGQTMPPDT